MLKPGLIAIAAMAIVCTPALAADEEAAPATKEAPAKPEPKICKKDRATGSLTRVSKICLTRTQWDELNRKTKDAIDGFTSRQNGQPRDPSNPLGT